VGKTIREREKSPMNKIEDTVDAIPADKSTKVNGKAN
jgi:hypothetical protein